MPKISFLKNAKSFDVPYGSVLMKALLANQVPVASSCQGDGICGKCKLRITKGAENLSAATDLEKILIEKYQLKKNERISCQAQVLGDVELDAGYW